MRSGIGMSGRASAAPEPSNAWKVLPCLGVRTATEWPRLCRGRTEEVMEWTMAGNITSTSPSLDALVSKEARGGAWMVHRPKISLLGHGVGTSLDQEGQTE